MDIRHIQYFTAVAEEKSFTKAALRLGIQQPPLSMQIKKLEEEMGAVLFLRTSNGVHLTHAGQHFLKMVRPIEQQLKNAVRQVKEVANGKIGQLRLGFTGTSILHPLIPHAIKTYKKQYPHVELALTEENSLLLMEKVQQDELDIAIIRPAYALPTSLKVQMLLEEELVAVLPQNYSYDQPLLDLKDFKNENFIMSPYGVSAGLYDATLRACELHEFQPKIGAKVPQIVSILSFVAANLGIALVPSSTEQLKIDGVQYKSLKNSQAKIGLALVYKEDYHAQTAINFASIIHSLRHQSI